MSHKPGSSKKTSSSSSSGFLNTLIPDYVSSDSSGSEGSASEEESDMKSSSDSDSDLEALSSSANNNIQDHPVSLKIKNSLKGSATDTTTAHKLLKALKSLPVSLEEAKKETNRGLKKAKSKAHSSKKSKRKSSHRSVKGKGKGKEKEKSSSSKGTDNSGLTSTSSVFKVASVIVLPHGLENTYDSSDSSDSNNAPTRREDLVLLDAKAPSFLAIQVLESQKMAVLSEDEGIEFDRSWSPDDVQKKLRSLLPALFSWFDHHPELSFADSTEFQTFHSPWVLCAKNRTKIEVVSHIPSPSGKDFYRNSGIGGGGQRVSWKKAAIYIATRQEVPLAVLQAWAVGNMIMEAPRRAAMSSSTSSNAVASSSRLRKRKAPVSESSSSSQSDDLAEANDSDSDVVLIEKPIDTRPRKRLATTQSVSVRNTPVPSLPPSANIEGMAMNTIVQETPNPVTPTSTRTTTKPNVPTPPFVASPLPPTAAFTSFDESLGNPWASNRTFDL